jgi:hypothetical protein
MLSYSTLPTPIQRMVCNLAVKFGFARPRGTVCRIQRHQLGAIRFRVHGKKVRGRNGKIYKLKVKNYEQSDIPIPREFLYELSDWKDSHPGQNLIVPSSKGNPNTKLLKMLNPWRAAQNYVRSLP